MLLGELVTSAASTRLVRSRWITENTVHWTKDVTFSEDASQVRRHHTPAVMGALRDLARATLHRTG
ncbi:hypothetical protein [Streptomyces albospinus]|uniref:hypothetical protein n=1 Tax=Streptomyces albospinus TaxID=285515 RepID=UPI00166F979D